MAISYRLKTAIQDFFLNTQIHKNFVPQLGLIFLQPTFETLLKNSLLFSRSEFYK